MILFKYPGKQREFEQCDPRIKELVRMIDHMFWTLWRDDTVITSIVRHDGSTHESPAPYRFLDIAIPYYGGMEGAEHVRKFINAVYPYDLSRPDKETIVPLDHGTAPHIHLQVSYKNN